MYPLLMVLCTVFIDNLKHDELLNIQEARKSERGKKIQSISNLTSLFEKETKKKLLLSKKGELYK